MRLASFACVALVLTAPLVAVELAPIFQDHMVLQRQQPLPIWGTAAPGEQVEVAFAGSQARATADADGSWQLTLPPLEASATGRDLVVRGAETITVRDVLVGDVWLLSGQSNMEWPVRSSREAEKEQAAATDSRIRHFKTRRTIAHQPQPDVRGRWVVTSPEAVGNFSAVGYFFAREILREVNVPIGLLNSTWGGTPVEAWLPPSSLTVYPIRRLAADHQARGFNQIAAAYGQQEAALARWASTGSAGKTPGEPWAPGPEIASGVLYNGMVAPHVGFALRGVLWYQGEANADQPDSYEALFRELIEAWRREWKRPDLPFYWVQLANWNRAEAHRTNWAQLRDAQTAVLSLPHTGQAVTIDIGDPDDIHPRNKQEVGRRLAQIALARDYGRPVVYQGPEYAGLRSDGDALRVRFEQADGLQADGEVRGFEVAGADRVFRPARAQIDGREVVVLSADVPAPVAVRYAWRNCPEANLRNGAGLPAVPFRSDDWPVSR